MKRPLWQTASIFGACLLARAIWRDEEMATVLVYAALLFFALVELERCKHDVRRNG